MLRLHILVALLFVSACNSTTPKGAQPAARAAVEVRKAKEELKLGDVPKADPREPRLAAGVVSLLEHDHVRPHVIDDGIAKQAFTRYIERLDPEKLLLLKSHVATLERDVTQLDDELRAGDFHLAHIGSALLSERRSKVSVMVQDLLRAPFDFNVEESLETDPKKRVFAESEQELQDLWRKTLKQQVLERIDRMEEAKRTDKKPKDDDEDNPKKIKPEQVPETWEGREKKAREELAKSYSGRFARLEKREPLESAESFINAFAGVYDPHTLYLAPAQQENFDIEISGSLEGIGAVLSEDDQYILVREVVPGGAAWRQGTLEAGDLILAVRQHDGEPVDVSGMRINDVVKMIRGPKGTNVSLTIKKPDERVLMVDITRDVVVVEASYARGALLDLGPKTDAVGYIYLPGFYGNTRAAKGQTPERDATEDVRALLKRFAEKKVPGVVLDLRGNGGGLLNHATGITGLLIDRGPVVQARGSEGRMQVLGDDEPGVVFGGEVVVLVDRFSASASEILAGALQDYRRALIVGTGPTHGKGTVQALIDLDRMERNTQGAPLGVVKLTIQQFFLVDGESTQWRGVQPDIVLPDPAAHVESGERYLEHAIPWSKVNPLPAVLWPQPKWSFEKLSAASTQRQSADPVFAQVKARGQFLEQRRKETTVQLARNAWNTERQKDRETLEKLDPKLDEGKPRFSVELVEYRPSVMTTEETAPSDQNQTKDERRKVSTRVERWTENLAHDPWIQEALYLVADMKVAQTPAKPTAAAKK